MYSPAVSEGLQVHSYSTLEVAVSLEKEKALSEDPLSISYAGLEALPPNEILAYKALEKNGGSRRTIGGFRRKIVWIAAIIALIVVVVAAVLGGGGVLGTRKADHSLASPTSSSMSQSSNISSQVLGSSLPSATLSPTVFNISSQASSSSLPSATRSPNVFKTSNLAAASWNQTANGSVIMQNRLYYQDTDGNIWESAWNSVQGHVTAPPDSNFFQMNVYYLNDGNNLRDWYTKDSVKWNEGQVNSQNIIASPISSLTAAWHTHAGCTGCPNPLLVVYQDSSSRLNLGNLTSGGDWKWEALNANAVAGSGLSLDLMWDPTKPTGLRLYYQTSNSGSDLHLCSLNWEMTPGDAEAALNSNWQNREAWPLNQISANASITSFTYGTVSSNGLPVINAILDSSSHGVSSTLWFWSGGGKWANGEMPADLSVTRAYTPLAANGNAFVYAVVDGTDGGLKEFVIGADGGVSVVGVAVSI